MNIFNPVRYSDESIEQFRRRRATGNEVAKHMAGKGFGGGVNSREQYRDSMRQSGAMGKRVRAYKALMNAWASKRITKAPLRDEHGAYTLIGRHATKGPISFTDAAFSGRRMWVAGISSQRGY